MVRGGELIDSSETGDSYLLTWRPTRKNREARPDFPEDAEQTVLVHSIPLMEVTGEVGKPLLLVTTTDVCRAAAAELYARCHDVEQDIRDVKVTPNTERIRARRGCEFLHT